MKKVIVICVGLMLFAGKPSQAMDPGRGMVGSLGSGSTFGLSAFMNLTQSMATYSLNALTGSVVGATKQALGLPENFDPHKNMLLCLLGIGVFEKAGLNRLSPRAAQLARVIKYAVGIGILISYMNQRTSGQLAVVNKRLIEMQRSLEGRLDTVSGQVTTAQENLAERIVASEENVIRAGEQGLQNLARNAGRLLLQNQQEMQQGFKRIESGQGEHGAMLRQIANGQVVQQGLLASVIMGNPQVQAQLLLQMGAAQGGNRLAIEEPAAAANPYPSSSAPAFPRGRQ
jgi:hypothetical protein